MDNKEVGIDDDKERFNVYIKMIETRIDDLIQIYINERKEKGVGMLFIDFCNKDKMDVMYNSLYDKEKECVNENFPADLYKYLTEYKGPASIIFFNIFDSDGNMVLTIDLDKNSKFLNN